MKTESHLWCFYPEEFCVSQIPPAILYEGISGGHCLCERCELSTGLSFLFWLSSSLGLLCSLSSAQATEEPQNVFNCNSKSTGHILVDCRYSPHMNHSKRALGSENEYEGKSLVIFSHQYVSRNHKLFWLRAHCLLWRKTSKPKSIIAMTWQSDTLISPVRMNTVQMNCDPVITIAELLRLNKGPDQKNPLEMVPSFWWRANQR